MIGGGESEVAPVTVAAFEGLGSRVLPEVSCQLVAPRETPLTALPRAPVWLFTCIGTHSIVGRPSGVTVTLNTQKFLAKKSNKMLLNYNKSIKKRFGQLLKKKN